MSTVTLRPIHNHSSYDWDEHDWDTVNDGSDTTYLSNAIPDAVNRLYKMSAPSFYGVISSVKVYVRARHAVAAACHLKPELLTHGTIYTGTDAILTATFADYYYSWSTNPNTGLAWTAQEVADLYAGYWVDGTSQSTYIADVWVVPTYTASPVTPFDQIIRPSSNNTVALTPSTGSNYACVDETTANDDTDYVKPNLASTWQTDLYNFGSLSSSGEILWVKIINRVAKVTTGATLRFRTALKTHSTTYYRPSETLVSTSYIDFQTVYGFNPYTGIAWTVQEIMDLIGGVQLYTTLVGYLPKCTQVYIEVYGVPRTGSSRSQIIGFLW